MDGDLQLQGPAAAVSSVHVAAYLGDATGNGAYSGLDAQRVARVSAKLDRGFAHYPIFDPVVVAELEYADSEQAPASVAYTITGGLANGQLELTTNPGVAVTSFTQAQIDAGDGAQDQAIR